MCTTVRAKIGVLIDLFILFTHNHLTKTFGPLSFILPFFVQDHSTKIRVLIIFLFLFAHDYSTKLGVILLFYIHGSTALIFRPLYLWAVVLLYFVCYVHGSTAFTFRPPYSLQYCPYIWYTVFMEVPFLYFVCYIHGYMKSWPLSSFFFTIYPE